MFDVIASILVWVLVIGGFIYLRRKSKKRVDYSLGLPEATNIKQLLDKGDYTEVEQQLEALSADNLTQVVDYITLNTEEDALQQWLANTTNTGAANLCLGVYYNHMAWKCRGHRAAKFVANKNRNSFEEYNESSYMQLQEVAETSFAIGEAYTRLIRASMGEGYPEEIVSYFNKAVAYNAAMVWPYIHYAEAIQPKWGWGSKQLIADLIDNLPERPIIQYVVELKLILDGFIMDDNYFGGSIKELKNRAKFTLKNIDKYITATPLTSVHCYVVYNYMNMLADYVGERSLKIKYAKLAQGHHTLYPMGVK